jgi:hypothetical protein
MCRVRVTPLQCVAKFGRKIVSASRVKRPSLVPNFDQTRARCGAYCGIVTAMFESSRGNARREWDKNCFRSKSKVLFFIA